MVRLRFRGVMTVHEASAGILRFFEYGHLPEHLARVSGLFRTLALELVENRALDGPELTVALRKLLEAKDAAVRAAVRAAVPPPETKQGPAPVLDEASFQRPPTAVCNRCHGEGRTRDWAVEDTWVTCPACKGRGEVG